MKIIILKPKKCFWLAIGGWGVAEILDVIFTLIFAVGASIFWG